MDQEGTYVLLKVEIDNWVSLKRKKIGGHTKDVAKHSGMEIHGSYKAKVVDFKMSLRRELWLLYKFIMHI